MQFREFTLDPFQEESIKAIDKGYSVVVSAATGTGKTLIADYLIDKNIKRGKRIVYTAPIKALSNQKYRDFKKEYGDDKIGLMTGDIVINPDADLLIMTTEIYRNMLLTGDEQVEYIDYVIFDEIHFIEDFERGTVWEESIIFSPEKINFLCLSATIPNAQEFADWISSVQNHQVKVIFYGKRAVPLKHYFFDTLLGVTDFKRLKLELETPSYHEVFKKRRRPMSPPFHVDLIKEIKDRLPALFFVFSRRGCEKKAVELANRMNFLTPIEKKEVANLTNRIIDPIYRSLSSVRILKEALSKGIAFHHSGLLPDCKEAVERLFAKGYIRVLYATETFAVGINYPAKSVCFANLFKYDGIHFRNLTSKEYFQMAGRAGRRGMDTVGYVYTMIDRRDADLQHLTKIVNKEIEPIQSQFKLSYNTVINLMEKFSDVSQRREVLEKSFYWFQKKEHKSLLARLKNMERNVDNLGFVEQGRLTLKGRFARRIYDKTILVTNLFTSDLYKELSDEEMNVLCASLVYEEGKNDWFEVDRRAGGILLRKLKHYTDLHNINKLGIKRMEKIVTAFTRGAEFAEVMKLTKLQEGDIIRLFRRTIDLLRQIRHATEDYHIMDKCGICMHKLEREPVKVKF